MINRNREDMRMELWMRTYVAVAGSSNNIRKSVNKSWADKALEDFDETFPRYLDEK